MRDCGKAKQICKDHDVKGFRKLRLKRTVYTIGRQGSFIESSMAWSLLEELVKAGYQVADLSTCRELAVKGLLDTISIS